MYNPKKSIEIKVERRIPATPHEVFAGWLDPKVPGTVWNAAEKLVLDARPEGLFYWLLKETPHYGRFTAIEPPSVIAHTWVSPNTLGKESLVTVTFTPAGDETVMTLVHSGLPDTEEARGHERGWTYFMELLRDQFGEGTRRKFSWEEAHPAREADSRR